MNFATTGEVRLPSTFYRLLLGACLALGMLACACDNSPKAPAPKVNIDKQRSELRQKVQKAEKQAHTRVDALAKKLPAADAGSPADTGDASAPKGD